MNVPKSALISVYGFKILAGLLEEYPAGTGTSCQHEVLVTDWSHLVLA